MLAGVGLVVAAGAILTVRTAGRSVPLNTQPQPERDDDVFARELKTRSTVEVNKALFDAYAQRDYQRAETVIREQITREPLRPVHRFNLAGNHAAKKDYDAAIGALRDAIDRGYLDFHQLRRSHYFKPLHDDPRFQQILADIPRYLDDHRRASVSRVLDQFSHAEYTIETDDSLKLVYVSARTPEETALARREVGRVAAWAAQNVFPGVNDPDNLELDPWEIVVLPSDEDFREWASDAYGPGWINDARAVGGKYDSDHYWLVAVDIGVAIRHEFMHLLHRRIRVHVNKQDHAEWIEEGLASLVESYSPTADGITLVPSVRTNTTARAAREGALPSIQDMLGPPGRPDKGLPALDNYAAWRSVFLYIHGRGELRKFYFNYVKNLRQDPHGLEVLKAVLEVDFDQLNADFSRWARALPIVPEWNVRNDSYVSLGLHVNPAPGHGPTVELVPAGSSASHAGLRRGDVILTVDGMLTSDVNELLYALSTHGPGDTVEVGFRRAGTHRTANVVLIDYD